MSEAALIASAERLGPWALTLVLLVYILANKLGPTLITDWHARRKAALARSEAERKSGLAAYREEHEGIERVYERLLEREDQRNREAAVLQKETVAFIASASEAVRDMTRSIDGVERQVFHLTEIVQRAKGV